MSSQNRILFSIKSLALFFLFVSFINCAITAQTTDGHFPVGAFMGSEPNEAVKLSYDESGLNTIVWKAYPSNQSYLNKYDVMAFNINSTDWINHYATGCYSKWESEENQEDTLKIGVKHIRRNGQFIGSQANWAGVQCWSTLGLNGPADSLIYGPHYFQAKKYRRVYGDSVINFITRFKMALNYNPQLVNQTDPVCKIKVVYRYNDINDNSKKYTAILLERTLKVSDFPIPDSFKVFDFDGLTYHYDTEKFPSDNLGRYSPESSKINYTDWVEGTGIQFCVDWLGNTNLGILYVDYAEVYDNDGWNRYINPITQNAVLDSIVVYAERYSNWNNIKYWYAHDEPHSIDAFIPIKTVDEIVCNAGSAPLITHFFEVNVYKNGEYIYEHFYNSVQPKKLMFDAYPFHTNPLEGHNFESLPIKLQQSHELQPGFYYVPQAFGLIYSNNQGWYKPSNAELNASVMLALAHGSKGILFSDYYSYQSEYGFVDAIVDEQGNKSYLWYNIHDNLIPRLTSSLGNILLDLNYTGNFLQYKYITPTQNPLPPPPNFDYLTIGLEQTNHNMNWHVGFLKDTSKFKLDNNYFLMANLWTQAQKSIQIKLTPPNDAQGYSNYRFRNIEPENNFDLTFSNQTLQTLTFPAGEGYLFQVGPVVKYGGKLLVNETVNSGTTLNNDMTIENGATLTVNGTYYANANITVKNGGKIVAGENANISFESGKNLIIDGTAEIKGTSANRLSITAFHPGIIIEPGSSLTMDYCDVISNGYAITTESGPQSYVNISNSNINALHSGISLVASSTYEGFQTPPVPVIQNCIITATFSGINVSNYRSVLLKSNTFTNCGISVSNVASAYIQDNDISLGTRQNYSGIVFNNSGGYIRNNLKSEIEIQKGLFKYQKKG